MTSSDQDYLRQQVFAKLGLTGIPRSKGAPARCPFHDDAKASMVVWPEGNAYCHAESESWSLEQLADLFGLSQPEPAGSALPRIEATYDYRDEGGKLLYQVVRFAGKEIRQRRPDPAKPGEWIWRLNGVRRVLYRLPELLAADPLLTVYIAEGEKDVDRLHSLGLIATTNPQGTGKWRSEYGAFVKGRPVVVIPDNDGPGESHALAICQSIESTALTVKLLGLPGLPRRGDVSDWLDADHTPADLEAAVEATDEWEPESQQLVEEGNHAERGTSEAYELTERNAHHELAVRMVDRGLLQLGRLITADNRYFFFDSESKEICEIESFAMDVLLADKYGLSSKDNRHKFVIQQAKVEARLRGEHVQIHRFAHYDDDRNIMYVDQGNGRLLKLTGDAIEEIDNGSDGVLFIPASDSVPWTWTGRTEPTGLLRRMLVDNLNFAQHEDGHTPEELGHLFTIWLLSMAFDSVQPTKPPALLIGPEGSGKSFALRRVGITFFGPSFQVDTPQHDKQEDFWVTVTNRHFAAYDNLDQSVKWFQGDLNKIATGAQISKRALYTNNDVGTYVVRCFLGLTARTPRFRQPDTASRLLLFYLGRMNDEDRRAEYQLLKEVNANRDELLTDYVGLLNRVVATVTPTSTPAMIRMADFAVIAARIGRATEIPDATVARILRKLKSAQNDFAAEESDLLFLLEEWFTAAGTAQQAQIDGSVTKTVTTDQLWKELKDVAGDLGVPFPYGNKVKLGKSLHDMEQALSTRFSIINKRDMRTRGWTISLKEPADDEPVYAP